MLAGEEFGRRHQCRLGAGFDRRQHGEERHHRLAAADIALEQAEHPFGPCHIPQNLGQGQALAGGEMEGQGRLDWILEPAIAFDRAAGLAFGMGADESQGQLVGEEFVIGQTLARGPVGRQILGSRRVVQRQHGGVPAGPGLALEQGRILPFRQGRDPCERRLHRLAHHGQRQPGGQAIDRLDRELGLAGGADVIGMAHLEHAVVGVELAADRAGRADRQGPLQPIAAGPEEGQDDEPGLVRAAHAIGQARGPRRLMLIDRDGEGDHLPGLGFGQLGREPAIDDPGRHMPDEIDDERPRRLLDELAQALAQAFERGDRGEEGVEDFRAQGGFGGGRDRGTIACLPGRGNGGRRTPPKLRAIISWQCRGSRLPRPSRIEQMPKARRGGSGKRRGDESVEGGCAPSGRRTDERCGDDRRYRDLIAAAADWLWESDADGRIEFLSPDFEASTGIAPQSLLGMRLAELAAVDAESFEHHEQRASIAAEKPFRDIVFKLEPAGGSGTWIEIAGVPIVEAGGFQGYRGIGKTVTARVEARLALQRYRQFVDVASDWFWETDVDNRVGYVSPNIESVLGLPVSAYIGKRLADTDGIVIEPEAGRASLAAIKARQPYRGFVYCRKLPNGKIVWITSSGVPFSGTDGAFRGYRGVARDVTAQVEAEQKLRENEARFRRLFEINSDYYWESDTQHRLTFASPESAHDDIFGVPVAQLLGKRPSETLAVKFDSETGTRMLLAVKARQPYRHEAFSIKHANGTVRWVSVSSAPRFGPDGEYLGR